MKPQKQLVKDLTDKSGPYTIKVKVISKTYTRTSPGKAGREVKFKRVTFEDDQGGQIKTTLYNDDIATYDSVLKERMEYEISNAKVKPVPVQYRSPDDHLFQLSFNNQTVIRPLGGPSGPLEQQYLNLHSIPKTMIMTDHFDVVGIMIFAEPLREIVKKREGQPDQLLKVREIVLTDDSTEQTLLVSLWTELAIKDGEVLKELETDFPVVGLTNLKPSHHKSFSLSATTSTFIALEPKGNAADALRKWKSSNTELLLNKQGQVLNVRLAENKRVISTVAKLREKQETEAIQEERHWLQVTAPKFNHEDLNFYLGCSGCGTKAAEEAHTLFKCTSCKKEGMTCTPRMTITFEATDDTGSYTFTAFTGDAEKLMGKGAPDLYDMPYTEKVEFLKQAEEKARTTPFFIQVGPSSQLSRSNILKWALKKLSFE